MCVDIWFLNAITFETGMCYLHIYNKVFTFFPGPVYEKLQKCGLFSDTSNSFKTFPTVHDAVIFAQCNLNKSVRIRVWPGVEWATAKLTTIKKKGGPKVVLNSSQGRCSFQFMESDRSAPSSQNSTQCETLSGIAHKI